MSKIQEQLENLDKRIKQAAEKQNKWKQELDEEAISNLENLKSKYSELAEIQDVSSHQYLTAL